MKHARFPVENQLLAMAEEAVFVDHQMVRAGWLDDDDEPDGDEATGGAYELAAGVAVVNVSGPLLTRAEVGWWSFWDGYDSVARRVDAAMSDPAVGAVVMSFDSPGGMAVGMVDGARALRMSADRWGKPLVAHGTLAASAAYGLACAADEIYTTADGTLGSIGTIATVCDRTQQNAKEGLNVVVLTSGTQKADGHPDVPLTAAATSRLKSRITMLAGMFAGWVTERRPQVGDPLALQGACVHGEATVAAGLADGIGTLDDAITRAAALAAARSTTTTATSRNTTMPKTAAQLLELTQQIRAEVGAPADASDEQLLAQLATLKVSATQLPEITAQRDAARAELATRSAAEQAQAREAVLSKHRSRGALSPALEANTAYMQTLAPLSATALDTVLSALPGAAREPALPRTAAGTDPTDAESDVGALTPEEKDWAQTMGITEAAMLRTKRDDAARRAARQ